MIMKKLHQQRRAKTKIVKSSHSYRRFPSDFFEDSSSVVYPAVNAKVLSKNLT